MCYFFGETGCYSNDHSGKKPEVMEYDLAKKIIAESKPSRPSYSLFGGEPLIYPHLEDLILEIKRAGSIVDTPTNGTLLVNHAAMLVKTKFDFIRVSLDGPREINNIQRGKDSYERALAGINALDYEKQKVGAKKPNIGIIYTVTNENYSSIEKFFIEDFNLEPIDRITIQMQNFITEEMGVNYAQFLKSEFGIESERYWRAMVRSIEDFDEIDKVELVLQVKKVCDYLQKLGKSYLLLPPTFSHENLGAYLEAKWNKMTNLYQSCIVPWTATDITASGDVAPCHVFYDLVMGNLYENSLEDIWNGEKFQKFRNYLEHNKFLSICPGCCILYLSGKRLKHRN